MNNFQEQCTSEQWEQLVAYSKLVAAQNNKINLISKSDNEKIIEYHIYPSLIYKILDLIKPNQYILDIGSGGGFPGIVNAIMFPKSEFLLIDSTRKKVETLNNFIQELNLNNCSAIWSRVEELNKTEYGESLI